MSKFTISQSFHNKKQIDIWLVKPTEKLDYAEYKRLEAKLKILGGYYSRFTRSFVFEKEPKIEQLNEAFGDSQTMESVARQAGVPQSRVAAIEMGDKYSRIDKRTLRSEYNAKKLLVAKTQYFDGMYDTTRYIPENELAWSDTDAGFEKQFDYSSSPYVRNNRIVMGDYAAKYKDDIVIPEKPKRNKQSSLNYYVDVEYGQERRDNDIDFYELDRIDSDSKDHKEGDRVVVAMYGSKYCGFITDKSVKEYQIRSWTFGGSESVKTEESIRYTVMLDNGVVIQLANFKIDTDNECDEISADAIPKNDSYMLAEQFWSSYIVRAINSINGMKRTKASRKKAEYAASDQRAIDRAEKQLFSDFAIWLGWEMKNKDYARKITGETVEEQNNRYNKLTDEYNIIPVRLTRPKSVIINKLYRANNLLLN